MIKKLIEIQESIKLQKNNCNLDFDFKYVKTDDILKAVKPLLAERELLLTLSDEVVEVGTRLYIKASATITDLQGETITATGYARESDDMSDFTTECQATGAASTYARKYALSGLFAIDYEQDPDGMKRKPAKKQTLSEASAEKNKPPTPATEKQLGAIRALCSDIGMDIDEILKAKGCRYLNELSKKQASNIIDALREME